MVALLDNAPDLSVDLNARAPGIVYFLRKISSQKNLFLFLTESHRPELFAHAPFAHHPPRQIRRFFDIIPSARCYGLEHELFRDASAEQAYQPIYQILPAIGTPFIHGSSQPYANT